MTAKGHLLFSTNIVLAGVFASKVSVLQYGPLILPLCAGIYFGTLLPDIDEPHSRIGRKTLIVSHGLNLLFGHRGLTHSLLFAVLMAAMSLFFAPYSVGFLFFIGTGAGCLLHACADMLTDGGIKAFFFPFFTNTRVVLLPSFLRLETSSLTEYIFIALMFFGALTQAYYVAIFNGLTHAIR